MWTTTSSIFHEANPGAVILTRYFPGGSEPKENAPVSSDFVVSAALVSMFERMMCALGMMASVVSVTVPERMDALGASGS
jgi:hypothetical protein